MNKQIINIFMLCVICISINAQSIEKAVITSTGGTKSINGLFIDWTLGEPVIETINNDVLILSEGFHQPSGKIHPMHRIAGNILGDGLPYTGANVFLYLPKADVTFPAVAKSSAVDGSFKFSFIPEDKYLLYAIPDPSDGYSPTYYVKSLNRSKAYILENDADIRGMHLQLIPKLTSTDEINVGRNPEFSIFPNPFVDELSISVYLDRPEILRIRISDLTGKKVLDKKMPSNEILTLDLGQLPSGPYILNIEGDMAAYNKLISKVRRRNKN
jgi:hypothetical protein